MALRCCLAARAGGGQQQQPHPHAERRPAAVGTVAGDIGRGHRDGAVAQARFHTPSDFALLPDGRGRLQQQQHLSGDLQQMSTLNRRAGPRRWKAGP
jgi:hypothetical protein